MSSAFNYIPARMSIANMRTGESIEVFFNPTELEKRFSVNWNRQKVPGLSHEPLQFSNVGNLQCPLELYAHAIDGESDTTELILDFENFIMSLCYPSENGDSIVNGAPPRVLFVWPNVASFQAVITGDVSFKHTQFAFDGYSLRYMATITIEEIRDTRISSEEVRVRGARRWSNGK